ncbi:sentrin-specific protease 8 [Stylonychia lemnae]|uniref:Sentrin-specific protease 8 n=1 Tax=Stylonychia lemnae TaxID=5949 RepID=A0A078B7W9_STYLE|nr:sentrin-specific protease 8 [Stylonychia lemnae]|eukprot:CDW90316.1 sentrin-specific protease 8 [Stylonychia lemnae]
MSEILLTYHSSTIRKSDLLCLNPQSWLNDQVINYFFEYISHELIPMEYNKRIKLLDPAVVADIYMTNKKEDLIEMYGHLDLHLAELIIMPVNNNQDPTSMSSWFYFDSSHGEYSMIENTAALMQNMKFVLKQEKIKETHKQPFNFGWGLSNLNQSMKIEYVDNIPKQHNNYDCGIYLMSFAESLVLNFISRDGNLGDLKYISPIILAHIDKKYVYTKRLEIRTMLYNMINIADLDLMEARVMELERYLGIEDQDMQTYQEAQLETLDKKTQKMDDFIKVLEDKHFFLNELFEKCKYLFILVISYADEQMESFLKKEPSFKTQCMDLQKKSNLILECQQNLNQFVEYLENIQKLEQYLNFEPVFDVNEKLQDLKKINIQHASQMITCQQNQQEVEDLIVTYNDLVERISHQMICLEAQVNERVK